MLPPRDDRRFYGILWLHGEAAARPAARWGRRRPLLLGRGRRPLRELPRSRVGLSGRRRPQALREDLPRGVPVRPELAHDTEEARGLPPRVPGLRLRRGR